MMAYYMYGMKWLCLQYKFCCACGSFPPQNFYYSLQYFIAMYTRMYIRMYVHVAGFCSCNCFGRNIYPLSRKIL